MTNIEQNLRDEIAELADELVKAKLLPNSEQEGKERHISEQLAAKYAALSHFKSGEDKMGT